MRNLVIAMPPAAIAAVLWVFFGAVCLAARTVVIRRCSEEVREELAEQAGKLLTGVGATFAFFVGFAISISWGAVSAGQSAVEQQAAAIQRMDWEIRDIPDPAQSAPLLAMLKSYASAAATDDARPLARGVTVGLPSTAELQALENAVQSYAQSGTRSGGRDSSRLMSAMSDLVSASASVAAVANRALPQPLIALLFVVAVLVSAVTGISTVTHGRTSMAFVYAWCVVPALSLAVVLALAYPFALRTGLTLAPLRAFA